MKLPVGGAGSWILFNSLVVCVLPISPLLIKEHLPSLSAFSHPLFSSPRVILLFYVAILRSGPVAKHFLEFQRIARLIFNYAPLSSLLVILHYLTHSSQLRFIANLFVAFNNIPNFTSHCPRNASITVPDHIMT